MLSPKTITATLNWVYWTNHCALCVLDENSGPETIVIVCYLDAFGCKKNINKWKTAGSPLIVTHQKLDSCNSYNIPENAKAGDWFLVYEKEFLVDKQSLFSVPCPCSD